MKKQLLFILFLVIPLEGLTLLNQELFRFTARNDLDGIQGVLSQGACLTSRDDEGYTVLHRAVITGNKETVALLLSKDPALLNEVVKSPVSTGKDAGKTALQLADAYGHTDIVTYLLQHGAEDYDAQRDLIFGCATNDIPAVRYVLTRRKCDVNKPNAQGSTPLHIAVQNKHIDVVQVLIEHQAQVNALDYAQRTPLHLASYNGDYQTARKLLQGGAQADALSIGGITPLMSAVLNEQIECVIVLLHYGAQTQVSTPYGTALNFAYYIGNQEVIQLLVNRGALATNGCLPLRSLGLTSNDLMEALQKNDLTKIALMIELGIDTSKAIGSPAKTPLVRALEENKPELALMFIAEGADIQWRDEHKATALHYATRARNAMISELLIGFGADIDAQDAQGNSPLHYAAQSSSEAKDATDTIHCLVMYGANLRLLNEAGKTPYALAQEAKNNAAELLNPDAPIAKVAPTSTVSTATPQPAPLSLEEEQKARWSKDRTVLMEHLEKNPDDARARLYLGLTEKWLGNNESAYSSLKKRAGILSFPEEDYYTLYNLAEVTELLSCADPKKQSWEEAHGYYLQAYAMRPHRAEPLIRLADYYLRTHQYDLSYLYARRATEIAIPSQNNELLPVQTEDYTHLRWEILSTAAHHIGEFEVAHGAVQKVALNIPAQPFHETPSAAMTSPMTSPMLAIDEAQVR